jgi:hypothetical protein
MFIDTCRARLPLTVGRFAHLQQAKASRVIVLRGSAWITIDNDPRDIVLAPGESFVVDTDARGLIYPQRSGQALEIVIDGPKHQSRVGFWRRIPIQPTEGRIFFTTPPSTQPTQEPPCKARNMQNAPA